jgi:inner membrane protein
MLLRTHLALAILLIVLFVQHVEQKFVFVALVLLSACLPDIDTKFSSWGRHLILRPLQLFVKHRGILHSLTFAIVASIIISVFWPVASFGFFIGYSAHLIADSFTKEGVQLFWPSKGRSKGFITTGGRIEETFFIFLVLLDVLLVALSLIF